MAEESYYNYAPSLPAAIIAVVIFTILTATHFFLLFQKRTWFCIPLAIGGILEIIGYIGRAIGNTSPASLPPYIMQNLLILLAPILFAASAYMFLSRIVCATGQQSLSIIRVSWLTKIFVGGDILCFLIQGAGGGILASSDDKGGSDMGKIVILLGLVVQMIIFGIFMLVAGVFHLRVRKPEIMSAIQCSWDWNRHLLMLYAVSAIITLRNLFRVIEYAMGNDGYLLSNEWPIYVFDALLMAIVLSMTCLWHLGQTISGKPAESRGDMEMLGTAK